MRGRGRVALGAAAAVMTMAVPARADDAAGARAFLRCYSCHSVDPSERNLPGPNLAGAIGRRAGSLPDFEYTPAMIAAGRAGLTWTAATLDRFLADPDAVVPGTTMAPPPGLSDAAERAAVIAYLMTRRAP